MHSSVESMGEEFRAEEMGWMRSHMRRTCTQKGMENRIGLGSGSEKRKGSESIRGEDELIPTQRRRHGRSA
jgi:hypothetical protein